VNRVCEPAEALRNALDWAAALAHTPTDELAAAKELLASAPDHGLTQHLALERERLLRGRRA
jgi:enoyl-CoA hydratase/carnithine racemase